MHTTFTRSPHGERYFRELHRARFDQQPSAEVFADEFDTDFGADDTLFVIVGADSGLLARWLATRVSGHGSSAIVVETDALHDAVREELGDALEGSAVRLCRASDTGSELGGNALHPWLFGGEVLLVESQACRARHHEGYTPLLRALRARLGELTHAAGAGLNQRAFIDAQIRNLADNVVPAASVGAVGTGRTAIVLGGGPSLDGHLDWVIAMRERLFVIAVSRIAGRLADAGVVPDAIAAVDPQDLLYDVSKAGLALRDTALVHAWHVAPRLLQQWRGPTLYLGAASPWPPAASGSSAAERDADNVELTGSTVSHAALWLAYRWGFERILLSGVDLCYAPGGATHASGSIESLCASLPVNYDVQVETYAGRRAGTAMALKIGVDELEAMGRIMAAAGVTVLNLAEDAARVASIAPCPPGRIVLDAPRPTLAVPDDAAERESHLRLALTETNAATRGLRAIRAACREAQRCLDGLHGRGGRAPDYRHKRRLDAIERQLERRHGRWMTLIKRYGAFDFSRTLKPGGFEHRSDDELEAWGRSYYRIIDEVAAALLPRLDAAATRIRHRLDELGRVPDVPALLDYWRRDGTLGRVETVFQGRILADPAIDESLRQARDDVAADIADRDTVFARKVAENKENAGTTLRTIALLFAERDVEDLTRVRDALHVRGERDATLATWADGLLAELTGDTPLALERYRELLDRHADAQQRDDAPRPGTEGLLEDVLLRIVQLQLRSDSPDDALFGLQLLCELSVAHVPRLATLLGLLGRHDDAIDLLSQLLETGQGDWRTARQIATLYDGAGAADAAAMARAMADELRGGGGSGGGGGGPDAGQRRTDGPASQAA